jgi:DNA repair protein RadD
MIKPHWYQTEAKNAIFNYFENGGRGNPLVCMPTGTGKSIVIADFLIDVFRYYPTQRVMLLTHVWKLIEQNAEKLQRMWLTVPLGIHSAGLGQRQKSLPIIYGGVQSVCPTLEKNNNAFGRIDLLLIDEAHLLGADDDTQYLTVIRILTALNPFLKVIGFTATPFRLKMGMLTDGGLFSDIAYNLCDYDSFQRLISEGFLCPLIGKPTSTKFEGIRELGITGGDYNQKQAEDLIESREDILYAACKEILEFGYDRQKCMVFAAGIKNAEHISEILNSLGAPTTFVHSKSKAKNKERLEAYSAGEYWAIVGANMLTTGYDEPQIDLIADLQPTCSPGKHVQKLGRGTRVLPNWQKFRSTPKSNTLALDFVGNIANNGPIDDPVTPRKPGQKKGDPPPVKICDGPKLKHNEYKKRDEPDYLDGCGAYNHASVRFCCNCANEFSFKMHVESTAYHDSPMKVLETPILETVPILRPVLYQKHSGKDKGGGVVSPDSIKAVYLMGIRAINHYLCFEHTGKARRLAHEWWMKHAPTEPPKTCDEFLQRTGELRVPKNILVHVNLKWPEIKQWEF